MLIAYNNDIKYQEKWYHIQTEDNGIKDGHITTTVFFSGQILDSKSTSYRDAIAGANGADAQNAIIKEMMDKQHRVFYDKLMGGSYDALVAQRTSPSTSRSPRISQPSIAPIPPLNRPDANNISGFAKAGKPDIVRASSQQMSASPNPLGIKSIAGAGQKLPNIGQPPLPSLHNSAVTRKPSVQVAQSDDIVRQPAPTAPIAVTNAVSLFQNARSKKAWRGFRWPKDDLAINTLVASLLETIAE